MVTYLTQLLAGKTSFSGRHTNSKEAQDANLDMLIDWINLYESRTDTFSKALHQKLYDRFHGNKIMYTSNECHSL